MQVAFLGELAALGTATMWSLSSIGFTVSSQRLGSVIVNRARLLLATLFVAATHWIIFGHPFPADAGTDRFAWLAVSAVIGLVIGDNMLFQSYILVGTRIGVLLLSLSPIFSGILAWLLLGETLAPLEVVAILISLGGVAWVVLERRGDGAAGTRAISRRDYAIGIAFGVGAAFCQSLQLVLAKRGMAGDLSALSAVVIRMSVAAAVIWVLAAVRGEAAYTIRRVRAERQASLSLLGATIAGPFIGVWLSLIAIQSARLGIASTLMAMTPVLSLPLVHWYFKEKITRRALLGTLVAVAGVAMMLLV